MRWKAFLQAGTLVVALFYAVALCNAQSTAESDYTSNCAMCHGKTGAGETPMGRVLKVTPFNDPTVVQMTDTAMNTIVTNGQGKMQAYTGTLSNDQVTALIQYIRQLQAN